MGPEPRKVLIWQNERILKEIKKQKSGIMFHYGCLQFLNLACRFGYSPGRAVCVLIVWWLLGVCLATNFLAPLQPNTPVIIGPSNDAVSLELAKIFDVVTDQSKTQQGKDSILQEPPLVIAKNFPSIKPFVDDRQPEKPRPICQLAYNTSGKPELSPWDAWLFALDSVVPFSVTGQQTKWKLTNNSAGCGLGLFIHKLMGQILFALTVLTFSGLLRKAKS